jgi:DNA-binding LacI/PurR family transcriptional regulator
MAVNYLAMLGHRSVAIVTGSLSTSTVLEGTQVPEHAEFCSRMNGVETG